MVEEERNETLYKAVGSLPEIQRRRFLLYYEYEFNFYQIAAMEHCTASAIQKSDSQLLEVNLLNQLKLAKRVNLFDYSLEELQAVHEYWRSMNRYSKQVLNKEKVA
ncbi:hypothetical protein [Streptococcus plurextorum]|uniref:hypothetical protein n=1 Tax=Streptococcus plurextorum TaxID=456876 RepID=UPI0012EBF7D1